jgi:hypothetical protein
MKIVKFASAVSAALVAGALVAQEEAASGEETSAEETVAAAAKRPAAAASFFTALPLCRLAEGVSEICLPNGKWQKAEEGRFYPFGTSYRTGADGILEVQFGPECVARISGKANFSTVVQPISVKSRRIVLGEGVLELSLAANLPEGAFEIAAPGFLVKNPAGKSKFDCKLAGDGQVIVARCVTGSFAVEGRHFNIAKMRAADEFKLRSTHDNLETLLYGTSGDYVVTLDVGMVFENVVADDGSAKRVAKKKSLEWNLSPDTKIRIQRMLPAIGERMSVDVTTWDAAGDKKNWWTYSEGRAEVNSGEQVFAQKADSEELAKRAAEAAETTTAEVEEENSSSENSSESSESTESSSTEG